MESAMDSRNDAVAAAAPLHLYPSALLSLPDLDRPPAIMEMWEVEAVAAALPAKKRRLRETFDRLAACSPTPLPFRWEDLDTYISSLQYSVTLRRRQLRELEKADPAPALLAPAPAAMSPLPVTGGGDVGHVRGVEKPPPAPVLPAVLALPATGAVDVVHELRALVKSKPVQPQPPVPAASAAAVSAPAAASGVHVEEGRKRKVSIQEAEKVHVAKRTATVGQAEMRSRKTIQEDAAVKKTTSPSHDSKGKDLMPAPQGDEDNNGLAAEANASTGGRVQVDPVSKVAILQLELPAGRSPATARDATTARNRVPAAAAVPSSTSLQPSRPPGPVPASAGAATSAEAVTAGRDLEKTKKRKVPSQEADAVTQHAVRDDVELQRHDSVAARNIPSHDDDGGEATKVSPPRRSGHGTGNGLPITAVTATAQVVDADPICKTGGIRHEPPATMPRANNATASQAISPPVLVTPEYEKPDVEMAIVQPEEMPHVLKEDASMVAKKACHTEVIKCEQADKASALARKSAGVPAATRDGAQAPKSAGVPAATRDARASRATRRAPPAAGSQQDARDVNPVPPRRGNGLAQSSRVSAGAGTQTDSALVRQGAPAAAPAPAPARRDLSATNPLLASRREHTGPSEASAPLNAGGRHVLQQQHMPKREPISSPEKLQERSSKNHGGRPTGSRPVPEAQDAAAPRSWSRPGEGRGGGLPAARGPARGDDNSNRNQHSLKGRRPLFCDNCGCKGHLAENCRTAKHLVALYQKAKEQKEKEQKQICFRCGCTGHWSRNCRTAKHLVDLYQKDRAAKRAARLLQ